MSRTFDQIVAEQVARWSEALKLMGRGVGPDCPCPQCERERIWDTAMRDSTEVSE